MIDAFIERLTARTPSRALRLEESQIDVAVSLSGESAQTPLVVRWQSAPGEECALRISPGLGPAGRLDFVADRLAALWPLFEAFYAQADPPRGEINLNLEDHLVEPGVAFCANRPAFLVPDPPFIASRGYAALRTLFRRKATPFLERHDKAFWRGGTTGRRPAGWRSLQRIRLCALARERPDLLDAGITSIVQLPEEEAREVAQSGLMTPAVPTEEFLAWRFQIDVDGNSNAWSGCFQKLATGSPVLKVESPLGFRQWFYDRLAPGENYVPVKSDLSDLFEKIGWLRENEARAEAIGRAGRALAYSLGYHGEIAEAVLVLNGAFAQDSIASKNKPA